VNAELKLHQKRILSDATILEMKLWEVTKTKKYPDGIKYGLIVVNIKLKKKVSMDNHTPKGHHYHIDDEEFDYEYKGIEQLAEDFYSLVKVHLGVSL
jgi:hypothetical protein